MDATDTIRLHAASGPVRATVRPPGSKSLTNRALLLAALADGVSQIDGILLADDSHLMIDGIRCLGIPVRVDEPNCRATVTGCNGRWPNAEANLYCGNAGTVIRFLTAACTVDHGAYRLDGVARMRERPIGDLVDALRELGAQIGYEATSGFCPLTIQARGLRGGTIQRDATASSQYVSALLMAGALATGDVMLSFDGVLPSRPYIAMTLSVMRAFGVEAVDRDMQRFIVPAPQTFQAAHYHVEPDASAASYFFAAAAVTGGRVTVEGLGAESGQGDMAFVEALISMGCDVERLPTGTTIIGPRDGTLKGIDVDFGDTPDVAQTLAVVAAFATGPTRIRNVANLRIKETDRLTALAAELTRMGVRVETTNDSIAIYPDASPHAARIHTYDDHRMAMSFAVAGLRVDGLEIENPACVGKTFPNFFDVWSGLSLNN
jgi:3-phosphoshikimate 1-carboxyvinyltransferase